MAKQIEELTLDEVRKQLALYSRVYNKLMRESNPEYVIRERARKNRYNAKKRAEIQALKQKQEEEARAVEEAKMQETQSETSDDISKPKPRKTPINNYSRKYKVEDMALPQA